MPVLSPIPSPCEYLRLLAIFPYHFQNDSLVFHYQIYHKFSEGSMTLYAILKYCCLQIFQIHFSVLSMVVNKICMTIPHVCSIGYIFSQDLTLIEHFTVFIRWFAIQIQVSVYNLYFELFSV